MMIKKKTLTIQVEKEYAKSVISTVKNLLWSNLQVSPFIESNSFDDEPEQEYTFYFVATDEKYNTIEDRLKSYFKSILTIKKD